MVDKIVTSQALTGELFGTFVFVLAVLCAKEGWQVAIGLLVAVNIVGSYSGGGVLNPAIAVMKYSKGDLDASQTAGYVSAEVVGALLALAAYRGINNTDFFLGKPSTTTTTTTPAGISANSAF